MNSSGELRVFGGDSMDSELERSSMNLVQSVSQKLWDGVGVLRVRGMFRVERMGRWSVLGPWRPGFVSH